MLDTKKKKNVFPITTTFPPQIKLIHKLNFFVELEKSKQMVLTYVSLPLYIISINTQKCMCIHDTNM